LFINDSERYISLIKNKNSSRSQTNRVPIHRQWHQVPARVQTAPAYDSKATEKNQFVCEDT